MIWVVVLVFGLLFFAFSIMMSGWNYSKIVDIEYSEFKDHWIHDGRPIGGKETRKEARFWVSGFSTSTLAMHWLFATPIWASNHPIVLRHLHEMRKWFVLSFIGFFLAPLAVILALNT